ncbi:MAG TPA: hypothetical protein VFU51_03240 [Gaiellaceae bacterium]|nr:hypothetical protein [Gaiellaceae bacterium]
MTAAGVREDEPVEGRTAVRQVEGDELSRDGPEQLRLASACGLRGRDLAARDRALDPQPLARLAAIVEDIAPGERIRLGRSQAFVGEQADEGSVLLVELPADRLDGFGSAGADRLGTCV